MLKRWLCQAEIALDLICVDPVLIKSGYATIEGPDMVPVVTYRQGKTEYLFPGSSLKGVVRAQGERIVRTLRKDMVCVPYCQKKEDACPKDDIHMACGSRLECVEESVRSAEIYRHSCPACRTFGSLQFTGRAAIGDAYPVGTPPVVEDRDGVGIDRVTGGAVPGAKFELRVITSGTFRTTISVRNFELWQLGLLYYLLCDFKDERLRVGSGKSRGLGRVKGEVRSFRIAYPKETSRLSGIYELSAKEDQEAYGLFDSSSVAVALPQPPTVSGLRHTYDITDGWEEITKATAPMFNRFVETGYGTGLTWKDSMDRFVSSKS